MQRRLRQQGQRVGLLLRPGRGLRGRVGGRRGGFGGAAPLVERLAGRVEGPQEQRADFRRQAPAEDHGAVLILVDVQRAARVLARGLTGFGLPVDAAPAPHDALHVDRRARAPHREQARLGLRGRDAGQGAHLGVGELSARQRLGQGRQRPEGAGHPDMLAGGARGESDAPGEPLGAGAEAVGPASAGVELADQREQAGRRRLEVGGELGDLVAQAIQLREVRRRGLRRLQRGGKIRRECRHGESPFLLGRLYTSISAPPGHAEKQRASGRAMIFRPPRRDRASRGGYDSLGRHFAAALEGTARPSAETCQGESGA